MTLKITLYSDENSFRVYYIFILLFSFVESNRGRTNGSKLCQSPRGARGSYVFVHDGCLTFESILLNHTVKMPYELMFA